MSREVEVKGIQMSATVPEDFQISLGTIGTAANAPETSETGKSLANGTGVLTYISGTSASDGNVAAPTHTWDWSNIADISKYYAFGRLIPASSTTGENIYYTPDATGVGKTVNAEGSYYQAAKKDIAYATNYTEQNATTSTIGNTSAKATLHAFTAENDGADDTWTDATTKGTDYTQAADWKTTNDDGYYVDIPVWIRTSSNDDVKLSVDGYVLPGKANATTGSTATELELYKAVRVAILNGDNTNVSGVAGSGGTNYTGTAVQTANIIPLKDAWDNTAGKGTGDLASKYVSIASKANAYAATNASILDSANLGTTGRTAKGITYASPKLYGVSEAATTQSTGTDTVTKYYEGTYAEYTALTPTNNNAGTEGATATPTTVATIAGSGTDAQYGAEKKLIIRVWLDGEDGECWNDNAGQDWAISLKFSKIES